MAGDCGSTCPVDGGFYSYDPNIAGNAILLAVFALLVPVAIFQGLRFQTPFFSAALIVGLLLEFLGFIGRLLLHGRRDNETYFFLVLLGTVLGPSLISAAVFLVLPHVLSMHGQNLSGFRPVIAGFVLLALTAAAVIVQAVGTIFTAFNLTITNSQQRTHTTYIVIAGLGVQTALLLFFFWLHYQFVFRMTSRRASLDPKLGTVYATSQFKTFLRAFELAALLLLVYFVYRIVEMVVGIGGVLFQSQAAFMVVDGALPALSSIILLLFHPGSAFGSSWTLTSPRRVRRPPVPLSPLRSPPGYQPHHRYDPNIRRQYSPGTQYSYSPATQKHYRHNSGSTTEPGSSTSPGFPYPGLPAHPKSGVLPRQGGRRPSERVGRASDASKDLVDRDTLW